MDAPIWFRQLKWSGSLSVAALNRDRSVIPKITGCYAFTEGPAQLTPGRVLYIGEAAGQSLRHRLAAYLVRIKPVGHDAIAAKDTGPQHKGKSFILESRDKRTDYGVFLS